MNKIILSLLLLCYASMAQTQKLVTALSPGKTLTVAAATSLVNTKYAGEVVGVNEKSSLVAGAPIYELIRGYDRTIRVSYQIPARTTLEWNVIRYRAADVLDRDLVSLISSRPALYESLYSLANNDFVPMSAYAPLNVQLNFRYNRTSAYRSDQFAPIYNSAPISTKTMIVRK
jgi:hypothetical protein